jgi:cell division protein FtsZ
MNIKFNLEIIMSINLTLPTGSIGPELKPRITVIGVGGAGGNAVNNMIHSGLEGVEFLVANSDAQALALSKSEHRIQMGINVTQGLGAGANPGIGQAAAEESLEEIISHIKDTNMVFITAGLGGGTGTGAAPVIAKAAREIGILTVGVVTKPFQFEGVNRMKMAEVGLEELQQYVDTLLIIPNQNLFRVANEKTTFADAFKMADDVLYSGVRGVTDLMVMPGLINLDFADIKSVMSEMGKAMMGTGEAEGERRATEAAEQAIANPLLDDTSMSGAKGVLINITAGTDITLFEVDEAANRIRDEVEGDVNIIFGSTFDETLEGRVRVSVVATGINSISAVRPEPTVRPITQISLENTKMLKQPDGTEENIQPMLKDTLNSHGESGKTNQPFSDEMGSRSIGDAVLPQPIKIEKDHSQVIENALVQENSLLEDDEIPSFLSEAKTDADVFIPATPLNGATSRMPVDPFAAADMLNANKAAEPLEPPRKNSGLSLFERVTGVARGNKRRIDDKVEDEEDQLESQTTGQLDSSLGLAANPSTKDIIEEVSVNLQTETKGELDPVGESITNSNSNSTINTVNEAGPECIKDRIESDAEEVDPNPQSLLGGLDSNDRLSQVGDQEDVLDIPAFLRRQAN